VKTRWWVNYWTSPSAKRPRRPLRESEDLYRTLTENSHAGIVLVNDSYRILYASKQLCIMTGYESSELAGEEYGLIVAGEYKSTIYCYYQARLRGESPPSRYEFLMRKKDGTKRWVEASVTRFTKERGETFVLAQLLDITERKEAADALRESEQRFRALFNATFQFTGILTPDGRMLEANQTALEFIGMDSEDIEGALFWESPWWQGDPEQQQKVKEAVRRAADGDFVRFEVENYGAGGRKINLDFNLKPIFGSDGKVVLLLPEGRDISDRIRAEEALKESEAKFRQVIQASPMGVYMYELEGPDRLIFKETNPAADQILGAAHRKMIGYTVEEAFPAIADSDLPRRMKHIAAHGAEPIKNLEVDYDDGRLKGTWELHIFQTAPGKLAVMFQDVTQRRIAEEEKARLESQLRQSQKMEAIGTLTGGIAHDFNNILGAILGTSEASLLKGNDFDSLRDNMASIRDMSVRGRGLVHRLLAFSRQDEQATRSFDLAAVVTDSLGLVKTMSPAKVDIKTDLTPDLLVMADPTQIQQVILNLCSNAIQAMGEEGGELNVLVAPKTISRGEAKLRPGIRPGPHVLLQISDTGHGIPPKVLDRIFDPFFTTKPIGRGTGLGLSLAHGIVKAHNGAINAESREGQGTTMSVLLPLASLQAEERVEPASAPTTFGRGEHVLVVDDEEIIVRSTVQTLEALGYRTSSFTSSLEAAAALELDPHGFDLILTDHIMPGLTGRQLAEKAAELRSGLPVILMTGMPDGIDEGGPKGQVAKILTKPVTVKEVGQAVRQVLDQQDHS
jgi:PAS domain S-box-containing protein